MFGAHCTKPFSGLGAKQTLLISCTSRPVASHCQHTDESNSQSHKAVVQSALECKCQAVRRLQTSHSLLMCTLSMTNIEKCWCKTDCAEEGTTIPMPSSKDAQTPANLPLLQWHCRKRCAEHADVQGPTQLNCAASWQIVAVAAKQLRQPQATGTGCIGCCCCCW
jgi:hypothetical protein